MSLEDEIEVTQRLLASGLTISAMNCIRNELSTIKAGRLAALAAPARVATLVVSDVPGDDPALVASGPTIPSPNGRARARSLVNEFNLELPPAAMALLARSENMAPLPGDRKFSSNTVTVISSAAMSLEAAARRAEEKGIHAEILSDSLEGEARDVGKVLAAIAREVCLRKRPFRPPVVLLSGGETTVTLRGKGRGGRNTECLLAFALGIDGLSGITALAADTDGIDGTEANAGAFADGGSVGRMRMRGLDPASALVQNDAYTAFASVGDLVTTGPTGTNVNDFRAIAII